MFLVGMVCTDLGHWSTITIKHLLPGGVRMSYPSIAMKNDSIRAFEGNKFKSPTFRLKLIRFLAH